jgi:hypothetical protein
MLEVGYKIARGSSANGRARLPRGLVPDTSKALLPARAASGDTKG